MTGAGFGYETPTEGASVEWYTPPEIFHALNLDFDLDVAAPPNGVPWIPAKTFYAPPQNGLILPWHGLVWMNPPYGQETGKWVKRLASHGYGIALVFARTDTAWWHDHAMRADLICFVRGRIRFRRAAGISGRDPTAASALLAFGGECAGAVRRSELGCCVTPVEERFT